jgi:hypothetical protein
VVADHGSRCKMQGVGDPEMTVNAAKSPSKSQKQEMASLSVTDFH